MRYVRNSVRRSLGQGANGINLAAAARRASADAASARGALTAILDVTGPVVERARERGTDASGTIRKIDRLAREAA